ncbi:family 20 glycosylhydrolase [Aureitalea sp. L0-47]|uniref:beta-N-acetylhexosaminidase n=1 Tax=Aureitalea sp. L0-47 TaxID=2816962 RepID=UPI002237E63A|nr:family 20 glycosylhydrolase [Aureitalea sp. L0-47]MCW5520918.1 family 20 glycosylhydrolase [Aureitalea sp. L0-47]
MNRPLFSLAIGFLLFLNFSCSDTPESVSEVAPTIIPKPSSLELGEGYFELDGSTAIHAPDEFRSSVDFLRNYVQNGAGLPLEDSKASSAEIVIEMTDSIPPEGYELTVSEKQIRIQASEAAGAFYAVQSLRQLLPPEMERINSFGKESIQIPVITIRDAPEFAYRGMHLDVARHFFPKEFVKEYISHLAMLKMNYFHWHLTEDQGWRIEIEQFPRLTSHAAYRNETLVGHYNDQPQHFDGERYGGFYTKEDIREIVEHARKHHITIVPEIEMPGHAQAAISAYPELGCTGEQIPVATKWGVFEDIYCPNQKTFAFLKGVLSEVIELFPGEYVHIGGDEAPKTRWKECNHCQKLIRELGLADEHELQSWFIKEIETFLNSKGKKMIGWDEILEGGLAPNATVMSWRGVQGGIEAAKAGHNVIMTPTSHAYFDYYQSDNPNEPLAIGGFLPLEKVYGFNPIPSELNAEEAKYVLGAQGNVWTEYMKTEQQLEYMIFPRMLAMSEVVWNGPTNDFDNDYREFVNRVEWFHSRLDVLGVNYANHLYTIDGKVLKEESGVKFQLQTPTQGKEIRYRLNGSEWLDYETPLEIREDSEIEALVFKENKKLSDTFKQKIMFHKGINGKISINKEPNPSYSAGGREALINGISGSDTRYGDSEWLGFWGEDLEIEIDLGDSLEISGIRTRFYHAPGQWIYAPKIMSVSGTLKDGQMFVTTNRLERDASENFLRAHIDLSHLADYSLGELKIRIPNYGTIPEGAQGAGNKAWTFIDEIIIE